jgi:hypothetical protein
MLWRKTAIEGKQRLDGKNKAIHHNTKRGVGYLRTHLIMMRCRFATVFVARVPTDGWLDRVTLLRLLFISYFLPFLGMWGG